MINPYLIFNGNCADAMRFYESALGGKLELLTHRQAPNPEQIPPGSEDLIMHGRLVLDDGSVLMGMDGMVGAPYQGMHGFTVSLIVPAAADAQRAFDALAAGGKVTMPFGKTFWADGFGMLIDRFGTPWMVNGAMTTVSV